MIKWRPAALISLMHVRLIRRHADQRKQTFTEANLVHSETSFLSVNDTQKVMRCEQRCRGLEPGVYHTTFGVVSYTCTAEMIHIMWMLMLYCLCVFFQLWGKQTRLCFGKEDLKILNWSNPLTKMKVSIFSIRLVES